MWRSGESSPGAVRLERDHTLSAVLYRNHDGEYREHSRGDVVTIADLGVTLRTEALRRRR